MNYIKNLIKYSLILIFINFELVAKEDLKLNWGELIPQNAYSFVPETGVTDEMWEDEKFLKEVEGAGLKFKEELIGKKIIIDGFMVPINIDYGEALTVEEFILVPDAGMCYHVPPPPPNQMIFIKLNKKEKIRFMYKPISVRGVLRKTKPMKDSFNSIYEMTAEKLVDINMDELNYSQ